MLDPLKVLDHIVNSGYNFFTGVPCSIQTALFNSFTKYPEISYVPATHEGEAVAIALGAQLAGKKSVILLQNTALGDILLPLMTAKKLEVPLLLLISWRGMNNQNNSDLLGRITESLIKLFEINYHNISNNTEEELLKQIVEKASIFNKKNKQFAFLIWPNTFLPALIEKNQHCDTDSFQQWKDTKIKNERRTNKNLIQRHEIIKWLTSQMNQDFVVLAPEGNTTKELFSIQDRNQNLYVLPLGYTCSIGLGIALNSNKKVIILDGDGSLIMRLSNLTTVGFCKPSNYIHILFNNHVYESTGGQPCVSQNINFKQMVLAAGYESFKICNDFKKFKETFKKSLLERGPHFLYVDIKPSTLSFSGIKENPSFYAQRFMSFLENEEK